MAQITVKAKTTAGYHPGLNTEIVKGREYTIDESKWGNELFERPSTGWLAPWEHKPVADKPEKKPTEAPVAEIKTGGNEQ